MNKHSAVDKNGVVHTRNSASGRVYAFAVVARESYESARARAMKPGFYDRKNYAYYVSQGDAGVAGYANADEYVQAQIDKCVAKVDANRESYKQWGAIGWCGRHDLAVKLARSYGGRFTEFDILPATMIQK